MVNSGGNDILADREIDFSSALRGYDRREVDAYIRRLRARAGHLASELEEKERRLSELGGDTSVPLQVVGSGNIGARVERIIAQAELEAREIREQAEKDAAEIRKAYEDQADEARRQREDLAKQANEEALAMIRRAEQEVERLRGTRQTLLAQLVRIGEIIDSAAEQAARTPELHPPALPLLPTGTEEAVAAESDEDDAVAEVVEAETAEAPESDVDETETPADEIPDAPEPRKPAETGKISPAILAAKARRQAKQEKAAAAAEN
ncbi:DivIVA domain-containing protein [Amycolatopsis tucumanensis]|uniref:Antigen 84 n=1 Tax=Amycolatopsis tucumanensis TaxID=401106 RepID=A0ABP7JIP4_9PSEU|nr:DivIVA domain-containing protein [Amycolatopsis tucumanensis]MCF6426709.1 DivIVA domain-containing protein [Amycolatopsis tucumanensis]